MIKKPKLVIMDLDGTLVDSQEFIISATTVAFRNEGLKAPKRENILSIIGLSLAEAFRVLNKDLNEKQIKKLISRFKDCYNTFNQEQLISPLYENAKNFLENLKRNEEIILAIATGKGLKGLLQILKAHNLEAFFSKLQTSDFYPSKPDPTMLVSLMKTLKIKTEDAVMVGDTDFDISMAHRAGIKSIGVLWGYHSISRIKLMKPTAIVENFADLEQKINELFRG